MNELICDDFIYLPASDTNPQYTYEIYATIVHVGQCLHSGHYFTIGKNKNSWYLYDDEVVMSLNCNGVNNLKENCTPYIIFCKRTDIIDPPEPLFDKLPLNIREALLYKNDATSPQKLNECTPTKV